MTKNHCSGWLTLILAVAAALSAAAQTSAAPDDGSALTVVHNTWSSGAAMPTAVAFPAVAVLKGQIYVVGGGTTFGGGPVSDTQIYNPSTNSWSAGVPLPTTLDYAVAAVVNGILYVIGGSTDGSTWSDAVWAYNPSTKKWSSKSPMPTARASSAATVTNNIIYVVGGCNGVNCTNRLDTVESYNPATNSWTEEAPLLSGKSNFSIGVIKTTLPPVTTIVGAGGYTSSRDTGDNEGYNPASNTWTALASDPTPRDCTCGVSIGSHVYVTGGYDGAEGADMSLTESFTLSTNKWKTLAPLPNATVAPGSAVYQGRFYCLGGATSYYGSAVSYVQIYQP